MIAKTISTSLWPWKTLYSRVSQYSEPWLNYIRHRLRAVNYVRETNQIVSFKFIQIIQKSFHYRCHQLLAHFKLSTHLIVIAIWWFYIPENPFDSKTTKRLKRLSKKNYLKMLNCSSIIYWKIFLKKWKKSRQFKDVYNELAISYAFFDILTSREAVSG